MGILSLLAVVAAAALAVLAQTFTPSTDHALGSVDLVLAAVGPGPLTDAVVALRSTSGGVPAGPDAATATISPSLITLTPTAVTTTFTIGPSVLASSTYAVVLRSDDTAWQLTLPYAGGTAAVSSDGTTFGALPDDAAFATPPASGGAYPALGAQTSAVVDLGASPADFLTLAWLVDLPVGTSVRFQIAGGQSATDTALSTSEWGSAAHHGRVSASTWRRPSPGRGRGFP